MNPNDVVLYGAPGLLLVMLLVQALKTAGMPSKWAPLAALICGFLVAGAVIANEIWPGLVGPYIRLGILGLMLGLAGSGTQSHISATESVIDERAAKKAVSEAAPGTQVVAIPSSTLPATGVSVDVPTGNTTRLSDENEMGIP